ncbi:MAG TPA: hypothetical protein VIL46_12310, partial [Gemmataceae bacterium]
DSSAPAAERVIGWHFNPAEPGGPSRFAAAGEYRRDYKRPGILKHLVARADLSAALRDLKGEAPPPDPRMGLRLEGNGDPVLTDGRLLVRRKDVTLALSIDPDFPLDRVASLHWELAGDAKRREFDPALEERAGRVRRAGLAGLPWRRGPLTLRAVLTTGGAEPRTFTQELALHYQPPPPQVELDAAWKKQNPPTAPGGAVYRTVFRGAKPRWAFAADVRPGEPGEEVSVRVRLNGGEWRESGPAVRETFELREGPNLVELEATHAAALKGYEENETARLAVGVVYQPPMVKVNPPEIDLALRVGERERTVLPGAVIVLDDLAAPSVPLRGTIRAAENLALAGLNKEPLKGFRPGAAETFRIEQELALRPGEQEFELRAKTASSEPAVVRFTLKYVPALPAAVVRAPRDGQELVEERDGDEAAVEVQFEPPDDPHPFTVYASVNGEPRGKPEKLDAGARLWKTRLRLEPGANAVRLHLGNAWGAERADGPVTVFLKRPPRIVRAEAGEVGKRPRVDLSAEVESPGELPPTGATLSTAAGEQAFGADAFTKGEADPRTGRVTWRFAAPQVPLEQGKNRFRLVVRNADGPSAAKDFPELAYEPPPPPKAAITFSGPPDQTVDVPRYPVSFTVRSASPLERVTVAHNGAVVHEVPAAELKKLAPVAGPGGEKEYVLEVEHVVRLEPRPNELRFTARNAGGDATAARTVSYVRVPPRVVIDRIEPFRNPAPAYEPEVGGDQRVIFPEVGPGHVRLVGRLVWGDDREAGLGGRAYVKVWVNGLQQLPTDVRPPASPGATERRFEVELVLNRAEDNLIELKVEGLPETVDAQRRCVVRRCAKPVQGQRLHLAVIGVGVKDGAALQREALRAVGATADERGRYSARPAFEEIELYPPVCGVVEVPNVNRLLNAVRERIRSRRRADLLNPVNDVVLLYYRGRERIDENGTYFLTSNPVEVIRCKDLARDYFPDLPGAQVLLLDVARPGRELPPPSARPRGDEVVHWPGDPNVARMRKARPAEAPRGPEPDLIEALGKALPGPGKLGELSRAVLELFQGQPYARFTPEVPGPLAELPIRGKP